MSRCRRCGGPMPWFPGADGVATTRGELCDKCAPQPTAAQCVASSSRERTMALVAAELDPKELVAELAFEFRTRRGQGRWGKRGHRRRKHNRRLRELVRMIRLARSAETKLPAATEPPAYEAFDLDVDRARLDLLSMFGGGAWVILLDGRGGVRILRADELDPPIGQNH